MPTNRDESNNTAPAAPQPGAAPAGQSGQGSPGPDGQAPPPEPGPKGPLGAQTPAQSPGLQGLVPEISLPTGGGAIRNIGEKFSANVFSGSGGVSVPIFATPSRGLGAQVSVGYSSGGGNGPFGVGWSSDVPSITRKTDKGLPRYVDEAAGCVEADLFIISGAEDLVELYDEPTAGNFVRREYNWPAANSTHRVVAYRPRVEGGFARIERWVEIGTGETHWETRSRENVRSVFGRSSATRIHDPSDESKIFTWLLEESHDDKGNVVRFEYKAEDLVGVDVTAPEEIDRLAVQPLQAQKYLRRIVYGNTNPYLDPAVDDPGLFHFELLFDYGALEGEPDAELVGDLNIDGSAVTDWPVRPDTFSTHRAGFEVRTRRLCHRVLVRHHFPGEATLGADPALGVDPVLVRSTNFTYDSTAVLSQVKTVQQLGYIQTGPAAYSERPYPPVEFGYQPATLGGELAFVDQGSLENLPGALDGQAFRLVDLDGAGIPGVLTEQRGAWYYKPPLGGGRFGKLRELPTVPSQRNLSSTALMDLDGNGCRSIVAFEGPAPGYQDRVVGNLAYDFDQGEEWDVHRPFTDRARVDISAPNVQLIDLDGDGLDDILVAEEARFVWYRSLGKRGFDAPLFLPRPSDERDGPDLIYRDPRVSIFYADMTGDGLRDIVRIENGSVRYWPNTGYGRFGRRITMRGGPRLDRPEAFRTDRIRLGDVDGSGTTDLVYLDADGATVFFNASGNSFLDGQAVEQFPGIDSVAFVEMADLLGKGTSSLVWSTQLPGRQGHHVAYVDLMPGGKPYLMTSTVNNMGAETRVRYVASTQFLLADQAAGIPWRTKLPFPVQVIERVEMLDRISGHRFATSYRYRHGYFDGPEREFRGFAYVESEAAEAFGDFSEDGLFDDAPDPTNIEYVPPVLTKTWFHTGAYLGAAKLSSHLAKEYYQDPGPDPVLKLLPDTVIEGDMTPLEKREAVRALKGRTLRAEIYALDEGLQRDIPYSVAETNFTVRRVQPRGEQRYASFFAFARNSLSYATERETSDPRVSQSVTLEVDDFGNALRTLAIAYPRMGDMLPDEQSVGYAVLSTSEVTNQDEQNGVLRLGTGFGGKSEELDLATEELLDAAQPRSWESLLADAVPLDVLAPEVPGKPRTLLSQQRQTFWDDGLNAALPLGQVGELALPYESETLAFTQDQLTEAFSAPDAPMRFGPVPAIPSDTVLEDEGGYRQDGADWWIPSGLTEFDKDNFYRAERVLDVFGNPYTPSYDAYSLAVVGVSDPLTNTSSAQIDYRVLAPWELTGINGERSQVAFDELGLVVKSAIMGRVGESLGDDLDNPTVEMEYDLDRWVTNQKPAVVHAIAREQHLSDSATTPFQHSYTYSDGMGRTIMVKAQAEPGMAPQRDPMTGELILDGNDEPILVDTSPALRWVGNGRTILDNRGNPIRQYEPYFSSTFEYEDEAELVEQGVTAVVRYDSLGRAIEVVGPDGTLATTEFTPWEQRSFDANDNVVGSDWGIARDGQGGAEQEAYDQTVAHDNTPTTLQLDALGRTYLSIADNGGGELFETRSELDIQGNVLSVTDARLKVAEARVYGQAQQALRVASVDAGTTWALSTAMGEPLRAWDSRGFERRVVFDQLRRPTESWVKLGATEVLRQKMVFGENAPATARARGMLFLAYDGAGEVSTEGYDYKGNPLKQSRRLMVDAKTQPDWTVLADESDIALVQAAADPLLDPEVFTGSSSYDALNRIVEMISPEPVPEAQRSRQVYAYNEAALLESVTLFHRGSATGELVVSGMDYDARGQRQNVTYSNGTSTAYTYDPETFRVRKILTIRASDGEELQDLNYTYDPVGNITQIEDGVQGQVYFANEMVESAMKYKYDPVYRLIEATGREQAGATRPGQQDAIKQLGNPFPDPGPNALANYRQLYTYDSVGNILVMRHETLNASEQWTRRYNYDDEGNRLHSTSGPNEQDAPTYTAETDPAQYADQYTYDLHGNMRTMPHLLGTPSVVDGLVWNDADQLLSSNNGAEHTYYQYAGGQRVRKVFENDGSTTIKERIYLGGWEVFRERNAAGPVEEYETLHVKDDVERVLMVETILRKGGTPRTPPTVLWRFQLSNHLGSASAELDEAGQVFSYEEFHPFGTSAYRAHETHVDRSDKRYRFTGMERDEETGLAYHGARYYAPWLGRWTASDPIGLGDGVNRFAYAQNKPSGFVDRTGGVAQDPVAKTADRISRSRARVGISPHQLSKRLAEGSPGLEDLLPPMISGTRELNKKRTRGGGTERTVLKVGKGGLVSTTAGELVTENEGDLTLHTISVSVGNTAAVKTEKLAPQLVNENSGRAPTQAQVDAAIVEDFRSDLTSRTAHELFHGAVIAERLGALDPDGGAAALVEMFDAQVDRGLNARFLADERENLVQAIGVIHRGADSDDSDAAADAAIEYFLNERFANVVVEGSFLADGDTNESVAAAYAKLYAGKDKGAEVESLTSALVEFFNALDPSGSESKEHRPSIRERQEDAGNAEEFYKNHLRDAQWLPF